MASEMVERVRLVICARSCRDGTCHYRTTVCEPLARAAIAAMREPTLAMKHSVGAADKDLDWAENWYVAGEYWRAMIDEALKE